MAWRDILTDVVESAVVGGGVGALIGFLVGGPIGAGIFAAFSALVASIPYTLWRNLFREAEQVHLGRTYIVLHDSPIPQNQGPDPAPAPALAPTVTPVQDDRSNSSAFFERSLSSQTTRNPLPEIEMQQPAIRRKSK